MLYLTCQPAIRRFAWEVEVQLENFKEVGIPPQDTHVVGGLFEYTIPDDWVRLQNKYPLVKFFFYKDTRPGVDGDYPPSLQSHILEKHWLANTYLNSESILFIDSDCLFTRTPNFTDKLNDDKWYFSDTISYVGATYIRSKGEEILDKMCEVVGIDKQIVINNELNSGGAQKLIKNVDSEYWKTVYDNSLKLFREVTPFCKEVFLKRKEAGLDDGHELQIWTSSMWVELWEGWKRGNEVVVPKDMDFMFYTNGIRDWDIERFMFYHSAGVASDNETQFFKGKYTVRLPYQDTLSNPDTSLAGYRYYQFMQEVGKDTCLI